MACEFSFSVLDESLKKMGVKNGWYQVVRTSKNSEILYIAKSLAEIDQAKKNPETNLYKALINQKNSKGHKQEIFSVNREYLKDVLIVGGRNEQEEKQAYR